MKKLFIACICLLMLCGCKGNSSNAKFKVGVVQLAEHDALNLATQGFNDALKDEFGEEVFVDIQNAGGNSADCFIIADGFVSEKYDLIMANATPAVQATITKSNTIPILGTAVTDYGVALDINNFNGVTGRNVSGTSDLAPIEDQAKMIVELFPNVKTVGLLFCGSEDNSIVQVEQMKKELAKLGVDAKEFKFTDSSNLKQICKVACDESDVLYVPTDNVCADNGGSIADTANENNIPVVTGEESTCIKCQAVATLSIDYYELGRITGNMAIDILKNGKDISQMKIEYYPNAVKKFNKIPCEKYSINVPSGYEEIEIKVEE